MLKISGKGGISSTVVADSVSAITGKRITTFEIDYPRFVHSEILTHRLFSRNAASSRAIPVSAMLDLVKTKPAMPIHWGANQPGMQAKEECNALVTIEDLVEHDTPSDVELFELHNVEVGREGAWQEAANAACLFALHFSEAGYHKQIVNRLLEPFQMMKTVVTATEWDNFFHLRLHPDAQPEIAELARVMYEALQQSSPVVLHPGEWHVPYVNFDVISRGYFISLGQSDSQQWLTEDEATKISASCCAQVSYRKSDDSLEKALTVYDRLVNSKPVHASPFEHQSTPMPQDVDFDTTGVTAFHNTLGFMSGNFSGWLQHRQLIEDNVCNDFKKEE